MKLTVLIITFLASAFAFSQTTRRYPAASSGQEINVNLGFNRSAVNLGATFEKNTADQVGWGGYLFLQTEKDDEGIYQTLSLGAMGKVHVIQNTKIDAYIAPGFGLTMLSDYPVRGNKDDKTLIGPSMRIGAQYYFAPNVKLGLERLLVYNWFDDEAPAGFEYFTAVVGFEF